MANVVLVSWPVRIDAAGIALTGDLTLPEPARGLVLFAHGSGSGRHSPRNQAVAEALATSGLGTLLLDLLTEAEERIDRVTAELRFDIDLLARRVSGVADWAASDARVATLPLGLFGASTGAAAALVAAASRPRMVRAVVSRGGRPDLAGDSLDRVVAPTLLIVGAHDEPVIQLNRIARERLQKSDLVIVPGATHLFEEPGALEQVSDLARAWFLNHLG
jgi:putative phosphoribosyl transferase